MHSKFPRLSFEDETEQRVTTLGTNQIITPALGDLVPQRDFLLVGPSG
jgi:hypothetical protein